MIRQSTVIQERNALIENLTFVIERIDSEKVEERYSIPPAQKEKSARQY